MEINPRARRNFDSEDTEEQRSTLEAFGTIPLNCVRESVCVCVCVCVCVFVVGGGGGGRGEVVLDLFQIFKKQGNKERLLTISMHIMSCLRMSLPFRHQ